MIKTLCEVINMIQRGDTLKEQAYTLIREKIMHQELPFGARLNIANLAREFQISNSPIREAVSQLENDGLVECLPNAGFRVLTLDKTSFGTLTQTIQVLLAGCYDDCVRYARLELLTALLSDRLIKQQAAFQETAPYDYACTAIDFDRSFVDACDNAMLTRMFSSKFDLLALYTLYVYGDSPERVRDNLQEHERILTAVQKREHDSVLELIAAHYAKADLVTL